MNPCKIGRGAPALPVYGHEIFVQVCFKADELGMPAGPMSETNAPGLIADEGSTPTLAERFRDLANGRKSLTTLRVPRTGDNVAGENLGGHPSQKHNQSHNGQDLSESEFTLKYLRELAADRPIDQRIKALRAANSDINKYSIHAQKAIWAVSKDLTTAAASLEARLVGYELLAVTAGHPGLGPCEREALYDMIVVPLPPANVDLTVLALTRLTHHGRDLSPFHDRLVAFLNHLLGDLFEATLISRRNHRRQRSQDSNNPIGEEVSLLRLLQLLENVIKHDREAFSDLDLQTLVKRIVEISKRTAVSGDIVASFKIMELLALSTRMSVTSVESCLEVLFTATGRSPDPLGKLSTKCINSFLRSEYKIVVREYLLRVLTVKPEEQKPDVLRGAFSTVDYLLQENGAPGLPSISLKFLRMALTSVGLVSRFYALESLRIIGRLLSENEIVDQLIGQEWWILHQVLHDCAQLTLKPIIENSPLDDSENAQPSFPSKSYYLGQWSKFHTEDAELKNELRRITSAFGLMWNRLKKDQQLSVVNLFLILAPYIDDNCLNLIVVYMTDERLIIPPNENWIRHVEVLIELMLLESPKADFTWCLFSAALTKVHAAIRDDEEHLLFDKIFLHLLRNTVDQDQVRAMKVLADFVTIYARDASMQVFESVVETFERMLSTVGRDQNHSIQIQPIAETMPNTGAILLVRLFLHCLPKSAVKTLKLYQVLISIAANTKAPHETRLTAMKLLTRLRCDSHHAIKVVIMPDSQGLATALWRTEASTRGQAASQTSAKRISIYEEPQITRTGRSSAIGSSRTGRSRSKTRSASAKDRNAKAHPPLWMYESLKGLPEDPPADASSVVYASSTDRWTGHPTIDISLWMDIVNEILVNEDNWEIYSYVLVHLPSQLSNVALFHSNADHVQTLHSILIRQLQSGNFHTPPISTGVKKGDVALCLYHTLTMLVGYHEQFHRRQLEDTIKTFLAGISMWDRVARCSIHALALCCHELPAHLDRYLYIIVQKMSQIITQSHLAMDILEFLGGLARLPNAHRSGNLDLFRTIFGICIRYLHHSWEQRQKMTNGSDQRASFPSSRTIEIDGDDSALLETPNPDDSRKDLPEYVFALAYHVITYWFLTIDLRERPRHVGWIAKNLAWKDNMGIEIMEEQSQVTLDMMHRTAYLDLGETMPDPQFDRQDDKLAKKTWLVGMSIVTVQTFTDSGLSQITKRQASGTTHAKYQQNTAPMPPHHVRSRSSNASAGSPEGFSILPNHVLLQQSSTITPMPIPMQPIILPDDDAVRRAISTFDRNDTVDGHKAGVIYIGQGQTSETEILANTEGSALYNTFLSGLGTKVCLHHAKFNTQGLDRESNADGTHTYAWRDRVTEIVFHVTTMMPTDTENDPQSVNKKRHIGNDYVNIIYNDSQLPFNFETFKSQFNHVNIVITPESIAIPRGRRVLSADLDLEQGRLQPRHCFKVQTLYSTSFPEISAAAVPKLVSASTLSGFVRQLALSASVFSLVWSSRESGEYVSSWRNRLRQIVQLRERYANTGVSANVAYPEMGTAEDRGGARSYLEGDQWRGTLAMGGLAEENQMLLSLDFSRWA